MANIVYYSKAEVDKFRKYGDVTPNGVAFDWWLINSNGAGFAIIREPQHTDKEIEDATDYILRERDVVKMVKAEILLEVETTNG